MPNPLLLHKPAGASMVMCPTEWWLDKYKNILKCNNATDKDILKLITSIQFDSASEGYLTAISHIKTALKRAKDEFGFHPDPKMSEKVFQIADAHLSYIAKNVKIALKELKKQSNES